MKKRNAEEIGSQNPTGIIKNVGSLLSKIPKVTLPAAPVVETHSRSKEQKFQIDLAELQKAQALAEAQRRRMRIL